MKSIFLSVLFVAVGLWGINDHAWAMGKRSRSSGTRNNHSSGLKSQSDPFQQESFTFKGGVGFDQELASLNSEGSENDLKSQNSTQNENSEKPVSSVPSVTTNETSQLNAEKEEFPSTTTAPEPATLTLMGLGMAGLMLRRPKK